MKNVKDCLKFRNRGITLIALVITIVVLLILAGVSIATLTGQNGILTRANDAKSKTEEAKEEELRQLTAIEATTYLKEHEYEDPSGETITIPAQCAVSQVEGENTLEDGLVIIDANGNEWLWIEVPESVTASATTDDEIKSALISYVGDYRGSYSDTYYEGCGLTPEEYADNYSTMLQSIKENHGFYIGRYEVGIREDINRYYETDYYTEHPIEETPVIQQDKYVYNWVRCSQAQELSESLAVGGKTSSLMFGIQWDLVLAYLEESGVSENDLKVNSSSWGNYSNEIFDIIRGKYSTDKGANYTIVNGTYSKPASSVLLTTGATERNSKMNIYDLAGNVWEWTLEKSTDTGNPCAHRGGGCVSNGSYRPASIRNNYSSSGSNYDLGFRPALY